MKFSFPKSKQKNEEQQEKVILFVCVDSAGTRPVSQINPLAVQAMSEAGIDISSQKSKLITEDMIKTSAKSVNMGCIERAECPMLFINNIIDWGIEDPKGKPIEKVREIRDEIERRVREIAESLQRQDSI